MIAINLKKKFLALMIAVKELEIVTAQYDAFYFDLTDSLTLLVPMASFILFLCSRRWFRVRSEYKLYHETRSTIGRKKCMTKVISAIFKKNRINQLIYYCR